MSFHTYELSYQLTSSEYRGICSDLRNLKNNGRIYTDEDGTVVCEMLKKNGVVITFKKFAINDYPIYMLYYRVNPRRVMEEDNYIGIFDSNGVEEMITGFDELVHELSNRLPCTDDCKLHRIDFCSNIEMSGQEEVYKYIKILQKGHIPKKYEVQMYYDIIAKRCKLCERDITIKGKNDVEISYYNKYQQMKNSKIKYPDIEKAKNILRAEIRCKKKKVRRLQDKFGYTKVSTFLKHSDKISEYIFKQYASVCYGKGDFYKLTEIKNKIDNSKFKEKSKKMMHGLAKLSAKHKSLQTAIEECGYSKKDIENTLKRFEKIDVSPVVIPKRYEFESFENPLKLVLNINI